MNKRVKELLSGRKALAGSEIGTLAEVLERKAIK